MPITEPKTEEVGIDRHFLVREIHRHLVALVVALEFVRPCEVVPHFDVQDLTMLMASIAAAALEGKDVGLVHPVGDAVVLPHMVHHLTAPREAQHTPGCGIVTHEQFAFAHILHVPERPIEQEHLRAFAEALSHSGSRRHDHHVAFLPATGHLVQLHEPGGYAAHSVAFVLGVLDVRNGVLDQVAHRLVIALEVATGDGVHILLALVQQVEHVRGVVISVTHGIRTDANEFA